MICFTGMAEVSLLGGAGPGAASPGLRGAGCESLAPSHRGLHRCSLGSPSLDSLRGVLGNIWKHSTRVWTELGFRFLEEGLKID